MKVGHPSDDETGLIYMRARHYDPVCGRFASEDPGRDGGNWFAYASDNPISCVDDNGRETVLSVVGLALFYIGLMIIMSAGVGDPAQVMNEFQVFLVSLQTVWGYSSCF